MFDNSDGQELFENNVRVEDKVFQTNENGEQERFENDKIEGQQHMFENQKGEDQNMVENMFESVKCASSLFGVPSKARSADPLSGGRCYSFITANGFDDVTGAAVTSFSNDQSRDPFSYARSLDRSSRNARRASQSRYWRHLSPSPPSG